MDVRDGMVVHAVKGEREKYQPIHKFSQICKSSSLLEVFETVKPLNTYIADLDKIEGKRGNLGEIQKIARRTNLILDIGINRAEDMNDINFSCDFVIGTETMDEATLPSIDREVFVSIDVRRGDVISKGLNMNIREAIVYFNEFQLKGVILLLLDLVGTESGVSTPLVEEVYTTSRHRVFVGGGITSLDELMHLKEMGIDGALVATAIHDRKVPLEFVQRGYI
jgi:phosphoribosylformimino-5-aminoimidazole carboxamide ribotide isomerase